MRDFFPYFQPLVSTATGLVCGYEALARTVNQEGMAVSAGALFCDPDVPKERLLAIDRQVRKLAVESMGSMPGCFLSLNILPQWIERLGGQYRCTPTIELVETNNVDPGRVVVEITEQAGDIGSLKAIVRRYREAGLKIAVDDFGAGKSHLDRVLALEPDYLKFDMQLFKSAARGGKTADVLLAISEMARRFGSKIVCEGVETEAEFFFGLECGAELMQGFLFYPGLAQPIPRDSPWQQLARLRSKFYKQKLSAQRDHNAVQREIRQRIMALRDFLLREAVESANYAHLDTRGLARFYICNLNGDQLSPNFDVDGGCFTADPGFIGHNWSWRPHFYELMVVAEQERGRTVTSRVYRDAVTGHPCKTSGIMLDDQRVLLVDCFEECAAARNVVELQARAASG